MSLRGHLRNFDLPPPPECCSAQGPGRRDPISPAILCSTLHAIQCLLGLSLSDLVKSEKCCKRYLWFSIPIHQVGCTLSNLGVAGNWPRDGPFRRRFDATADCNATSEPQPSTHISAIASCRKSGHCDGFEALDRNVGGNVRPGGIFLTFANYGKVWQANTVGRDAIPFTSIVASRISK